MSKKDKFKISMILLVPFIMLLNIVLKENPQMVEKYYSNSINKLVIQGLSFVTGIFPFSIGEFLVISLVLVLSILLIRFIIMIRKLKWLTGSLDIICYLSVLYILFMILWGFNYQRLTFDKIANLKVEQYSKSELYGLCEELIEKANTLRMKVEENSDNIMYIPEGYNDVFDRVNDGYTKIQEKYPELRGSYGRPKAILFSQYMTYTGITGIYIPYTGEANVNINTTDLMLPCTVAHEIAHQRGFAREEEANYIAYLVCINNKDVDFQYSGIMLALINSMNKLAQYDLEGHKELETKYSKEVKDDLIYQNKFWSRYQGSVEELTTKVNDNYLKYNGEESGVESYGEMVNLLLAEYKEKFK
ncbi:MAG: DUF3810 domain-containing protein [Clostridiaceae bacterium]